MTYAACRSCGYRMADYANGCDTCGACIDGGNPCRCMAPSDYVVTVVETYRVTAWSAADAAYAVEDGGGRMLDRDTTVQADYRAEVIA